MRPTACCLAAFASLLIAAPLAALAQAAPPAGEISGTAWEHTPESLAETARRASLVVPEHAPGRKLPVVVFLHGSSGLSPAIREFQQWLATQGFASIAPDSFALPGHVTYKSPIDKASYERIHALRAAEIGPALKAVLAQPWADASRVILAGTSEGAVPVARHAGAEFAARIVYAWSCEANYFVEAPRNAFPEGRPVLNVISASDPFFAPKNAWLGNADAAGHCGAALKGRANAAVVLVPDAPHTLFNLPAARAATAGFLQPFTRP